MAIALFAAPAVGQAKSVTFGIRLDHEPSNSAPAHNCNEDGNDDVTPAAVGRRVGTGPTVAVQGNGLNETGNPIESFRADLKIKKGDSVGIDSASTSALYCSSGGDHQMIFSRPSSAPRRGRAPRRTAASCSSRR